MFSDKTDYVGLGSQAGLKLKSNSLNATNSVLQIPGDDGSILSDQLYGSIAAPQCEYTITADATLTSLILGQCYGLTGDANYALNSYTVTTGAGQEPTVAATAVQIESGNTATYCTYSTGSFNISPARHASMFNAFTYTKSLSCVLENSEYNATADISPATINGTPVASDATAGVETVNVTFWSTSDTIHPTVTLSSNWHQTADWTCTGADSSMFVWTATFTHYLSASHT